jgi:hypothetical protein
VIAETLAVAAVLALPQVFPLVVLVGPRAEAFFAAPLLGALTAGLAGMATLAAGTPLLWYCVLCAAVNGAAASLLVVRRRRARARKGGARAGGGTSLILREALPVAATLVCIGVAAVLPIAGALHTPALDWDARSIWMLHARWFYAGHDYLTAAIANPVFAFYHSDYPPAIPATVSVAWQVTGHVDLRLAQIVVALLNASACALLGCALVASVRGARRAAGIVLGAVLTAAAIGVAGGYATDGYADLLAAATAAAAVLYGLVAPRSRPALVIAVLCGLLAGTTKIEGLTSAVIIFAAVGVRYARPWSVRPRRLLRIFLGAGALILPLLVWPVLAYASGARSDVAAGNHLTGLLRLDPMVVARVGPVIGMLRSQFGLALPLVAAAALLGAVVLRSTRRRLALGGIAWTWAVMVATLVVLVVVYAVGPYPIQWWLNTSVDRTTMLVRILLLSEAAVWGLVALDAMLHGAGTVLAVQVEGDRHRRVSEHLAHDLRVHAVAQHQRGQR